MNVIKCAVLICIEDRESPVEFEWKWGEDEPPVVDYCRHLDSSWDAHVSTVERVRYTYAR